MDTYFKSIINIYSYNSRGFNADKQEICRNLLNTNNDQLPILCNQENFLLKSNGYIIEQSVPELHIIFKPATKVFLDGRPKNGMFIAIPKSMKSKAKDVSPNNSRLQAIILDTGHNKNLLIINAYFPQDPKTIEYHVDSNLEDILAAIGNLIGTCACDDVIIAGDLNIDFNRKNGYAKRLRSFLEEEELASSWDKFHVDFTHEFEVEDHTYTCTIDHFLWNNNSTKDAKNAGVLHLPGNLSDHSPIYCETDIAYIDKIANKSDEHNEDHVNLKLLKQSDWDEYNNILEKRLNSLAIPRCVNCRDVHCENPKHIEDIDNYAFSIMKSMDESIKMIALKNVKNKKKSKIIPGWNDLVKPYKEDAIFWHAIWSSAGKPINNTLHNIMKRTRNIYHYHIRKCRRSADMVRKNKLMDACLNGNGDVFEEIRKMRKVNKSLPHTMDGQTNVTERFKNVYQKLYNSVNDEQETQEVLKLVNNYVDVSSLDDVDLVNQSVVRKAVNNIKLHKNDPIFTFNSDCIKRVTSVIISTPITDDEMLFDSWTCQSSVAISNNGTTNQK